MTARSVPAARGRWLLAALIPACGADARVDGDQGWPDTLDIAFIDYDDRGHIWLAFAGEMQDSAEALAGEFPTRLLGWSPCGDEIAMQLGPESTQILAVGAEHSRVVGDLWMAYIGFRLSAGPWWSSDGMYVAAIGAVSPSVGVLPACGLGEHLYVCEVGTAECSDLDRGGGASIEYRAGAGWSPGGHRFLGIRRETFCTTEAVDGETVGEWAVIVRDLESADVLVPNGVGEPTAAAWSPSGDRVVVTVERDAGPSLLVWHLGSGATETVAAEVPSAVQLEWLPDASRWLLVAATVPRSLLTLDAVSGEILDVSAGLSDVVLAPDGLRAIALDHDRSERVLLDLETRDATPVPGDRHWWRPRCDAR